MIGKGVQFETYPVGIRRGPCPGRHSRYSEYSAESHNEMARKSQYTGDTQGFRATEWVVSSISKLCS